MAEAKKRSRDEENDDVKQPKESLLKKKPGLVLIIAVAVTMLLSVSISTGVTILLIPTSDVNIVSQEEFVTVQETIAEFEEKINQQEALLTGIDAKTDEMKVYLRHSSATAIKNIMIDQEKNIQSFLVALKAGMRDLSVIVRGSADWQQDYDNQINIAIEHSIKREQVLQLLKTGAPD